MVFGAMNATGYIGDKHPGQWTPFWEQACAADRPEAFAEVVADFLERRDAFVISRAETVIHP